VCPAEEVEGPRQPVYVVTPKGCTRSTDHWQIYSETRKEIAPDAQPQEVYVLRDGFSGFQARYRVCLALLDRG
jgi:hypothetical protein